MNIAWYFNRLRVMGVRETAHRVYEQADLYRLRFQQRQRESSITEYVPGDFDFCRGREPQLGECEWDFNLDDYAAEQLLAGCWPALAYDWRWQQQSDWHLAPDTGRVWPQDFFGNIAYRAGNPVGDVRVAWEPSRLQQLISLALLAANEAYRARAVALFESLLLSWLAANPAYRGPHYVSAMECALRLLAVCHAVDMIRPYLTRPAEVWQAVLGLVDSHASLIIRRLSLFSSSGNHTIAECAGLIYAGELFPELPAASNWSRVGVELLEQEAARQFYSDGGGIEQALGYHLLITDLCNLSARLLAAKAKPSQVLEPIVASAMSFLADFFSESWQLPNIGDADGGFALSPHLRISHQRPLDASASRCYADSGYSIIREGSAGDRLIVFDHGSLGMAPSFGHGHSDCLSLYWREQGEPILLDTGTYTYTGDAHWRHYFRSAAAHNTVTIDGEDQAVQQGAFMWSQPFEVQALDGCIMGGHQVLMASHSGFERLGYRHHRAVLYNPAGSVLVWDFLRQLGPEAESRELSLWWHLAGSVAPVRGAGSDYRLETAAGAHFCIQLLGGQVYGCDGEGTGLSGWASDRYGEKHAITTLEARHNGNFSHDFYTYITPGSDTISSIEKEAFSKIISKLRHLTDD